MPRPTLFDHPKFARLSKILGLPRPYVLGLLEFIWRVGYSSGNPVLGDAVDVELAAEWPGEDGALVRALTDPNVRLLDARADGKFEIHDFADHAPEYVKWRSRKEKQRKKLGRRSRHGTVTGQSKDKIETVSRQGMDTSATPALALALALDLQNVDPKSLETVSSGERSLRARDEPATVTPQANGNGHYPPPLIDGAEMRRHGQHRWCGRVCVTYAQHKEFARRLGKPDGDADAELMAWYPLHVAQFDGQVIGDPMFTFWNNGFAQKFGLVTRAPKSFETKGERTKRAFAEARAKLAEKRR